MSRKPTTKQQLDIDAEMKSLGLDDPGTLLEKILDKNRQSYNDGAEAVRNGFRDAKHDPEKALLKRIALGAFAAIILLSFIACLVIVFSPQAIITDKIREQAATGLITIPGTALGFLVGILTKE